RVVWRRGRPAAASHGHSRPADHATLTVAERACRTADWLDPTRVSRPCGGVGGKAPPSSVGELRDLLQPGAHAPCARQGCSAPSTAQTVGLIASVTWLGGLYRHYVRMT